MTKKTEKKTQSEDKSIIAFFDELNSGKKGGGLGFSTIRKVAQTNSLVQICTLTLKSVVTKIPGFFKLKEGEKEPNQHKKIIKYLENLKNRPNSQENKRIFWNKIYEDVLIIDRGAIEIVRNSNGEIVQLWQVDGASIYPRFDEYGILSAPAYVQKLPHSNQVCAEFDEDEMIILIREPSPQLNQQGYGISPVEKIINTVLSLTQADNYNAGMFTHNQIPPFMATIPGASSEEIAKLQKIFQNNEGLLFKGLFTNATNLQFHKLKPENSDMQYYELMLWLARIVIAAFGLSPQDLGLTMDINKATGETQAQLTKNQGLMDLLDLRKEFWDEILYLMSQVDPVFSMYEYDNEPIDKVDELKQAEINKILVESGIMLIDEIRQEAGLAPLDVTQSEITDKIQKSFYA